MTMSIVYRYYCGRERGRRSSQGDDSQGLAWTFPTKSSPPNGNKSDELSLAIHCAGPYCLESHHYRVQLHPEPTPRYSHPVMLSSRTSSSRPSRQQQLELTGVDSFWC